MRDLKTLAVATPGFTSLVMLFDDNDTHSTFFLSLNFEWNWSSWTRVWRSYTTTAGTPLLHVLCFKTIRDCRVSVVLLFSCTVMLRFQRVSSWRSASSLSPHNKYASTSPVMSWGNQPLAETSLRNWMWKLEDSMRRLSLKPLREFIFYCLVKYNVSA